MKFSKYDGSDDTITHVFRDVDALITLDDNLHANVFTLYLMGEVFLWFNKLAHGSIEDFGKLKKPFINFYKMNIPK